MHPKDPWQFDARGRTAQTDDEAYARQLIEQVLFTAPGERVNRPDFGSGLPQLIFAGNTPELATATQFLVQGALQKWLGDIIEVREVGVEAVDSTLRVRVGYILRRTREARTAQFVRETP